MLLIRQLLVAGMPQLAALSVGGSVAYPGVLLAQLSDGSQIPLDLDTSSWIGSIHGIAGIPSILMPVLMQWRGRKLAFIGSCLISTVGWILAFTANSTTTILISESFHGLGTNSLLTVSLHSISEMVDPKFRNISMISFFMMQTFGMALVGIIERYLHWKTVSLVMGAPVTVAMFMGLIWPESPSWLACKGNFEKCEEAFIWLRGTDEVSKNELNDLIAAQKKNLCDGRSKRPQMKNGILKSFHRLCDTLKRRDFYIPSFHVFVLLNLMYWSGSAVIIIYSAQILKQATHNEEFALLGSSIMSSILFVCNVISAGLLKKFENKSVLLISALSSVICMLSISLVNYMQMSNWVSSESMICFYLFIIYSIVASLGIMSLVFVIAGELMPVKHRGIGGALYVVYTCILHSSSLKIAPYLLVYINLRGTLILFSCNAIICGLFVWKYVPETKGKTLQEIEDFYMFGDFKKRDHKSEIQKMQVWLNDTSC